MTRVRNTQLAQIGREVKLPLPLDLSRLPRQPGFTLMELLIALAIVAILAALAWPSYNKQVLRGYRAQAIAALLSEAAQQERIFAVSRSYSPQEPYLQAQGRYEIQVSLSDGQRRYLLKALPKGPQRKDSCGVLQLNNSGDMEAEGDSSRCWRSG